MDEAQRMTILNDEREDHEAWLRARQAGWIYEDDLPASMTQSDYDIWAESSKVIMGIRMGPPL